MQTLSSLLPLVLLGVLSAGASSIGESFATPLGDAVSGIASADAGSNHKRVYIFAGQSNMVAAGTKNNAPPADVNDVSIPFAWTSPGTSYSSLHDASSNGKYWSTLSTSIINNIPTFGPELQFARERYAAGEKNIAILKSSRGGTGLVSGWLPGLYDKTLAYINASLAELTADGYTYEIAGILWYQGETDGQEGVSMSDYQAALANLMSSFRADLQVPDVRIGIVRIRPYSDRSEFADIRNAQMKWVEGDANAFWVSADDYGMVDGWHIDKAGVLDLGTRLNQAFGAGDTYLPSTPPVTVTR